MNYIRQINAFEQWLETHHLALNAQMLWYKLMHSCSRAGWPEWLQVDNLRLMAALQTQSKATFLRCRDALSEAGLIEVQKGRKGSPNKYRLIPFPENGSFFEPKTEPQTEPKVIPQTEPKMIPKVEPKVIPQTEPIYKTKTKTKTEENKKENRSQLYAEIIDALNTAAGTSYRPTSRKTQELINARLAEGYTVDDFRTVIAKKAAEWKDDPKMAQYLRPETLFGTKFEGYLGQRPAGKKPANAFHNFTQRETDYDALLIEEERRWST